MLASAASLRHRNGMNAPRPNFRVLIVLGEGLPPQQSGGSQKVALEIADGLSGLGDEVWLAGRINPLTRTGFLPGVIGYATRRFYEQSDIGGHSTFRYFREGRSYPNILEVVRPDVVLMHTMSAMPLARMTANRGVPLVLSFHDVEFRLLRGEADMPARFIANSRYTAEKVAEAFGRRARVVNPIFAPPPLAPPGQRTRVLFVGNHIDKGVDRAVAVAQACPEIPFEFIESWTRFKGQRSDYAEQLKGLPNVTITPRQPDLREALGRARLLLMPSRWEEAWGRVATEAQANGIPVLASCIGGLPESVGPGGVLISPQADIDAWVRTLRSVWQNPEQYEALATAARDHSIRPEVDPRRNLLLVREELASAAFGFPATA